MAEILLGCPFCGEKTERRIQGISIDESINALWEIYCFSCGGRGPKMPEQELAVRGWNRRVAGRTALEPDDG